MGLFTKSTKSFEKDVREMIDANPDSLTDPEWEDGGVTVRIGTGHRLQIWRSDDGVFFDMTVADAAELGRKHGMNADKAYRSFGFFTPASFAMRENGEMFFASAISTEKYTAKRLRSVTNRMIMQAEDFAGYLETWEQRLNGGGAQ